MTKSPFEVIRVLKAAEPNLRSRGICHLAVFGSVARGADRPDSDVDISIDIEPGRPFSLFRMEETRLLLADALGRSVDLGETSTFRPNVRQAFDRERVTVF